MVKSKYSNRNEKLFDAVVKVAVEEALDHEIDSYPNEEELNRMYPRSAALDKRVKSIINKAANDSRKKKLLPLFVRVAASFAVLFTVTSIILLSVEASRNFILNIIISIQDDHVLFDFEDSNRALHGEQASLKFIPYGFEYVSSQHMETQSLVVYMNEAGERIVLQNIFDMSLSVAVGNVNRTFSVRDVNGHEMYIFESLSDELQNMVMWAEGEEVIIITSTIAIESLIEIVESMVSVQP